MDIVDTPLVRFFATEYSSDYHNLIRNGIAIDDDYVMRQLNVKKEKTMIGKVIDWFVQVFEGY
jgi:hypothetical protein